jgi:hypothetical protein
MQYFTNILDSRSNCLLMSEDTMRFNQYNRKLYPKDIAHFALSYILSILQILMSSNEDMFDKEFRKDLKKATTEYQFDKQKMKEF